MSLLVLSLIAGILTALAPCVLPLLPVIVGSALGTTDRLRSYIIVGSLVISLMFFTIALKATSNLLAVPPLVWQILSGFIIIGLGIASIWPRLYDRAAAASGFAGASQRLLGRTAGHHGVGSAVLTGLALGPVFSSCSPTYALILATVLPVSFGRGLLYLGVYIVGLGAMLLGIVLLGRRLTSKLGWVVNPEGWFKRTLGIIFILLGIAIVSGFDKTAESYAEGISFLNISNLETGLLPHRTGVGAGSHASAPATNGAVFALNKPVKAPEITGITNWINSSGETIAGLKGKVVLIDFWTYSCINCIHTLPHVTGWYEKYQSDGLVVLGIHAPEFSFEHVPANVAKAVTDDHITYPVGLDNDYGTWNAYDNQYWPAEYFIDRQGNLRHYTFGEGNYANDELVIQALLSEGGPKVGGTVATAPDAAPNADQSPETYLGYARASGNANSGGLHHDVTNTYTLPSSLKASQWGLGGSWNVGSQDTVSGASASLTYNFTAKQVYLVMGAATPATVSVRVNGQLVTAQAMAGADVDPSGNVTVSGARLYRLVNTTTLLKNATLRLDFQPGVTINAFTFDS